MGNPYDDDRVFEAGGSASDPVARFIEDLRETYSAVPDARTRRAHLTAMSAIKPEPGGPVTVRSLRRPSRLIRAAFAGAALTIVSASALAATGALPDAAQDAVSLAAARVGVDLPEGGEEVDPEASTEPKRNLRAEANYTRAKAFVAAKKSWTECVKEAAREHRGPGGFDPEAACGEKPSPQDFRTPKPRPTTPAKLGPDTTPKAHEERTPKPERTTKPSPPRSENAEKERTQPGPPESPPGRSGNAPGR